MARARGTLAIVLLLATASSAQEPDADEDARARIVEMRAERITWVHGAPLDAGAAPGALGGLAGPATAGWRQHRLVLQSGPREDARLVVQGTLFGRRGRPAGRDTLDVRAEQLVVSVRARGDDPDTAQLLGVYAEGDVRLVAESPEGTGVIEAAEVLLDLQRSFASLRDVELRARPAARGGGPAGSGGGRGPLAGPLAGQGVLLRAERLRVHGADRIVAERVLASPCDLAQPHVALTADRLEVTTSEPSGVLLGPLLVRRRALGGSDAQRRAARLPRWIDTDGVGLRLAPPFLDPVDLPLLPFGAWRSDWPLPRVRVGRSSQRGTYAVVEVTHGLPVPEVEGRLDLQATEEVEYYSERGLGGELGLAWDHAQGAWTGEGSFRAFGIDDRADEDRSGAPVETEHRYWLRGLLQERLPGGVQVDAELSKLSDRGVLLEYHRRVAQSEKEQETYAHARWYHDDLALRAIGRFRVNDFQTQLEQLPEAKADWIHAPLLVDDLWGGLYLDVAARAGHLRVRFDEALGLDSYRARRADVDAVVSYKRALGPLVLRAWGGARESAWSDRPGSHESIDRFSAQAGWNLNTTFWRDHETPWGVLRHELVPDVGSRHVLHTSREPSELLPFDEVEALRDTDHLFLRLRSRLLTDIEGRRHLLLDAAAETRYFPSGDHGLDVARTWGALLYDVRLYPTTWLALRARGAHDLQDGRLLELDATASFTLLDRARASVSWRDLPGLARALGWGVEVALTDSWLVGFSQQYDFVSDEFLRHEGRIVRRFHCVSLEVTISHDPQDDETQASFAVGLAPLLAGDADPFEQDRWRELNWR